MKTKQINIRVSKELKALLDKIAADDKRTLSGIVHFILTDYVTEYEKFNGVKGD